MRNRETYITYKNCLTTCLRAAEEAYYLELIDREKKNVRKLWQIFGPIVKPSKRKKSAKITKIIQDDKETSDNQDIANIFNTYFSSIGEQLPEVIKPTDNCHQYMRNRNNCSMFITPVSEEELHKQLIALNKHKATGPDEVSPGILRLCVKEIVKPFTHIISLFHKE